MSTANTPAPTSALKQPPTETPQPERPRTDPPPPAPVGGRPRRMNAEKQQQFCNLLRLGCSRIEAARAVGVSLRTVYNQRKSDPDFAAAVRLAICTSDSQVYRSLVSAGQKSWRAAAWLIEHRARHEHRPRAPSPEAVLKSPQFQSLLRDLVCHAVIANEITADPGIVRRKARLAELRAEIESRRCRGEEAMHLENIAHDLAREIAKTLQNTMRLR